KIAPFLSTGLSLAGPWGAMAASALGSALGTSSTKPDDLELALTKATPEQIAAIRKAENDFQVQMKQLEIESADELLKMGNDDRASARQMQMQTRSWIPGALAIAVTVGFFALLAGMMFGKLKVSDNQALILMLGSLSTSWGMVIAYYF